MGFPWQKGRWSVNNKNKKNPIVIIKIDLDSQYKLFLHVKEMHKY